MASNLLREHRHYLSLKKPIVAVWQQEYDGLNQRTATTRPDGHRVSWLTYGSGHLQGLRVDEHELIRYDRRPPRQPPAANPTRNRAALQPPSVL